MALVGLLLDWLLIRWSVGRKRVAGRQRSVSAASRCPIDRRASLRKPAIVIVLVLAGFLGGVPPAMMAAIGAALMLITRTREPRQVYDKWTGGCWSSSWVCFSSWAERERAGLDRDLFAHGRSA